MAKSKLEVHPREPIQFPLFEDEGANAGREEIASQPSRSPFSNFVVYVDESGDHGMQSLDTNYPMFVLAFCVFYKRHYSERVVPSLHKFKFNYFGHDAIVLHEHEIRKETGKFRFASRQDKQQFLGELTDIIEASNFILISCAVDKAKLRDAGDASGNPYHMALGYCLETLFHLMQEKKQDHAITHVIVECRGKKEDDELELEFRRICDGANRLGRKLPFEIVFADKKVDSPGLQLADLVARPIGLSVLRPTQENRAFETLKQKFFCSGGRQRLGQGYEGWGLEVLPPQKRKAPVNLTEAATPTGNPQSI